MKQFEYKNIEFEPSGKFIKSIRIDSSELENQLNEIGRNGWELVNSTDYSLNGYTQKIIMFFKREIIKPYSSIQH